MAGAGLGVHLGCFRLQAGSCSNQWVQKAGLRLPLGLLFRGGLELIRVSFPKNPHKQ
jgi:hypothetical protein